jgi:hypothetical protein
VLKLFPARLLGADHPNSFVTHASIFSQSGAGRLLAVPELLNPKPRA